MNESGCSILELVRLDIDIIQCDCNHYADSSMTHMDTAPCSVPKQEAQIGLQRPQLPPFWVSSPLLFRKDPFQRTVYLRSAEHGHGMPSVSFSLRWMGNPLWGPSLWNMLLLQNSCSLYHLEVSSQLESLMGPDPGPLHTRDSCIA